MHGGGVGHSISSGLLQVRHRLRKGLRTLGKACHGRCRRSPASCDFDMRDEMKVAFAHRAGQGADYSGCVVERARDVERDAVASKPDRAGLLPRPEVPSSTREIGRRLEAGPARVIDRTPRQMTGQFQRRC